MYVPLATINDIWLQLLAIANSASGLHSHIFWSYAVVVASVAVQKLHLTYIGTAGMLSGIISTFEQPDGIATVLAADVME